MRIHYPIKTWLSILPISFISLSLFAGIGQASKKTTATLISDDGTTTEVRFEFAPMAQHPVSTPKGEAVSISIDGGTPILEAGSPDLPKVVSSIIIPDNRAMEIVVTASSFKDYENIEVAPSRGTLLRTTDPKSVPYTYGPSYTSDVFFPKSLATLRAPYILRDYRGQTVVIYPFQYNAVTKVLRVYSEITVKITPANSGAGINAYPRTKPVESVSRDFDAVYRRHFLNYESGTRYEPLADHGNMLVITHADFMEEIEPFVTWKTQTGMHTEVVDVASIGNTNTAIKDYVKNYYSTTGLTYLLLVGDDAQVTSSSIPGAGDSDNDYGYLLGSDHYQEIFVGRISAEYESEVVSQVTKILAYEKTPLVDDYYAQGVAIASNEGPGDDNEMDWEHERGLREMLESYTYASITELFDGTHAGGNDEPGNPNDDDLATLVNAGTGIVNYTGHGSTNSIVTTGFTNNDVFALTNTTRWPFVWIVGCVTGNFTGPTCFAEAWARATYEEQPVGSVSNFMSTVNQYWDEPMEAQDEMNAILTETYAENDPRSFGGISINGCFSMNDHYGNSGFDMTDTWVIFGDPSLLVRTELPTPMSVTHESEVLLGLSQFTVGCDFEGALVALTQNNTILGSAFVGSGIALVEFDPLISDDSVLITITGFNKIPYIQKIPANANVSAYVISNAVLVNDPQGNGNGMADYAETVGLDVTLENVGLATAGNVVATLSTTDPSIIITDAVESYGDMDASSLQSKLLAFSFNVADDVADGHEVYFTITITDALLNTWSSNTMLTIQAPVLETGTVLIDDASGNGDGHLDPGESATLLITNLNTGHSNASGVSGTLSETSSFIDILNAYTLVGDLSAGAATVAAFDVVVYGSAPYGMDVMFTYVAEAGAYSGETDFTTTITPAIEDFESNDFLQFSWELTGNSLWQTQSTTVYEGMVAARSGTIGDNQSSTLLITLDVQFDDAISFMKKVSSENDYDKLSFYIDGALKDQWSGEMDWSAETYPVSEGLHTFKWTYKKDNVFELGSDCSWLDNIELPAFQENPATGLEPVAEAATSTVYPNPFQSLTFIHYQLESLSPVTIRILDAGGRLVKSIIENEWQTPGTYQLGFDGTSLPGGTYFCEVSTGSIPVIHKLITIR